MDGLTALDLGILGIVGFGVWRGLRTGALSQFVGTLGLVVGLIAGVLLMQPVGAVVVGSLGLSERLAPVLGFVVTLGVVLGLAVLAVVYTFVEPLLAFIGVDSGFRGIAVDYVRAIMFGMPAICVFLALRFTTEGIGFTKPMMYLSLFALVCNVFLNWVFIYGHFGAPAMGAVGCGVASAITMWLMMLILGVFMYLHPRYRPLRIFSRSITVAGKYKPACVCRSPSSGAINTRSPTIMSSFIEPDYRLEAGLQPLFTEALRMMRRLLCSPRVG